MIHPAQYPVQRLLAECEINRTRGSGPGGQHRNKVETAIVVVHLPTGLRGEASERRPARLFALREGLICDARIAALDQGLPERMLGKRGLNENLALPRLPASAPGDLYD